MLRGASILKKVAAGIVPPDVDSYGTKFGIPGYIESGNPFSDRFSPARFFVGRYTIEIDTLQNGDLQFRLENDTSVTSAGHQVGLDKGYLGVELPSWSRPLPFGTISQTFT